ncbi:hypothetical protein ACSCBZ_41220 [Streptomyces niveiscabiei]|uniref:hypothetical protein n=1 Tax=Streptomyces niveiscabiei TaxID=164115 RepID=UPI000B284FC6|nr:hypothetical protein [Streptomyces niveiscabiei]
MTATPQHRALAYVLDDRWFLMVVSPSRTNSAHNRLPSAPSPTANSAPHTTRFPPPPPVTAWWKPATS